MSHYWADNVNTTSLTPRDYQVELLASALEKNVIVCVGQKSSKEFIALKLIQELALHLRQPALNYKNKRASKRWTIYITNRNGESTYNLIYHLTDLKVFLYLPNENSTEDDLSYDENQVIILTPLKFLNELILNRIHLSNINLLIIEDCHDLYNQDILFEIFNNFYSKSSINLRPKVLCLAGPLHSAGCLPVDLKGILDIFEQNLYCEAETASDIVTVLRYCTKPTEIILQCGAPSHDDLTKVLEEIVFTKKEFLKDHRYDPSEIYSDEFSEELQGIPDPKTEPNKFLDIYLEVLHEMGAWCADRVALNLLSQIEKQKVKTPYERHFLLLCLVSTTFVELRSYCDYIFHKLPKEKDRIEKFSSPKILRLLEVLRCFKPEIHKAENKNLEKSFNELDQLDFRKLTNTLENTYQMLEKNENRELRDVVENLENIVHDTQQQNVKVNLKNQSGTKADITKSNSKLITSNETRRKNTNHRQKRRFNNNSIFGSNNIGTSNNINTSTSFHHYRYRHRDHSNDPDALCGILFCNSKNTAKVLFDLLCEMSRHDPELGFLCVQYTVDRVADPISEPKEAESEHRRQEDVLKRFRMHDCNLLIGTAVLEEGIDLPKCNLVIRWDPPSSYRSYVQCKGRARAAKAYHIILVSPNSKLKDFYETHDSDYKYKRELLSDYCHKIICQGTEEMADMKENPTENNLENDILTEDKVTNVENQIISCDNYENNNLDNKSIVNYKNSTETELIVNKTRDKKENLKEKQDKVNDLQKCNGDILIENLKELHLECNGIKEIKNSDNESRHFKTKKRNGFIDNIELEIISLEDAIKALPPKIDSNKSDSSENDSNDENEFNYFSDDEYDLFEQRYAETNTSKITEIEQNGSNPINFHLIINSNIENPSENMQDSEYDSQSSLISENSSNNTETPIINFKCYASEAEKHISRLFSINIENSGNSTNLVIDRLAEYREIEKILLQKCANNEPTLEYHIEADKFTSCVEPYKPLPDLLTGASVDLTSAISLVNRYCAKLPSDTFTKLTPLWRCAKTLRNNVEMFQYTIRLPINSPLKYDIPGLPMPTEILARRMAALLTCRELHKCGELDNNLQPIGKEGFRASEPDWENFELEEKDEQIVHDNSEPRPGTTKRRQYYYKRIANEFSNCRPTAGATTYLYFINLTLECPIPEEQNTRGRKIYPPEEAQQGFGILTLKKIPKISSFPIFTRSGEVKVALQLSQERVVLSQDQIDRINTFLNYTFTNVLRLQKFLMLYDPDATENSIFIVPTIKSNTRSQNIAIDWQFLNVICKNCEKMPTPVSESDRKGKDFDSNRFKDAVVMPWYRNQDQPQYFYVAEICYHLSPESCFPGENYKTFQEYYFLKYNINIQNTKQPLLDVDHTSARLNFLTPRYVNRKGVALPTSSEETKRAKRENLEQKQILVPELCTIHPFPASLWRAAVCLPCILYRINGLLLADEIRKKVSFDLALGRQDIFDEHFEWPMLDFGWSLAEVLKKCKKSNENIGSEELTKSDDKTTSDINLEGKPVETINEQGSESGKNEKTVNDILEEADEKLKADTFIEIGTWSNDMAKNIDSDDDLEDDWGLLPSNINLCSTNNTNIRYGSPTSWDVGRSSTFGSNGYGMNNRTRDRYFSDSDDSYKSDEDYDMKSMISYVNGNNKAVDDEEDDNKAGSIRIEFKSNNVAEAIETEEQILKRQKQLAIIQETSVNEKNYQLQKNKEIGFELKKSRKDLLYNSEEYVKASEEFRQSVLNFKNQICSSGILVRYNETFILPKKEILLVENFQSNFENVQKLVPYIEPKQLEDYFRKKYDDFDTECIKLKIQDIEELNKFYIKSFNKNGNIEKFKILGIGDIFDSFNDSVVLKQNFVKEIIINFKTNLSIEDSSPNENILKSNENDNLIIDFSFDYQPDLTGHPGPSPSIILQALTMSNANDGINLERLETIGDSFLKYAITSYLYCTYENVHEGKLSHLRSKQVSNLNLYRLGRRKVLGECMIATKFEPHDNWLPPCYYVPKELEKNLIEAKIPPCHWNLADLPNIKELSSEEICELVRKKAESLGLFDEDEIEEMLPPPLIEGETEEGNFTCFIPYNLVTQHSIPDKSIADCVEALIGAYLIECGPRGALLFMAWLGIRVLPLNKKSYDSKEKKVPGTTLPDDKNQITIYGQWAAPKSPLLKYAPNPYKQLEILLDGFYQFEDDIGYHFKDRSYLLQAMTHASYSPNRLTDCYQRLEFLGDAVLDYLITRHLYEDPRQHSPGALTDLRSALVNNTIFASLAVRHGFHKYFRHLSPGLNEVIDRFVRIQHENGHIISEEFYLLSEEECDDAEDVEVPKALGDVFESVAGAIFLDSNMSLDMVWKVYSNMMKPEIEQFSNSVPKSPIRELLELEPETAKFGRPEKLADGRRVRVTVEVFGKGIFRGIGRNYRIAKCTAAKCALRQLKKQGLISKKH